MSIFNRLFHSKLTTTEPEENKALARMCRLIRAQIRTSGAHIVRKQVVQSIDNDCLKAARNATKDKGGNTTLVDVMGSKTIRDALATPEYMTLLRELGLDKTHIETAARDALRKAKQEVK